MQDEIAREGFLSGVVNYSGFLMAYPAPGLPPARQALSTVLSMAVTIWLGWREPAMALNCPKRLKRTKREAINQMVLGGREQGKEKVEG